MTGGFLRRPPLRAMSRRFAHLPILNPLTRDIALKGTEMEYWIIQS